MRSDKMMKQAGVAMIVAMLMMSGCSKDKASMGDAPDEANDIVASVNGKVLTRHEVDLAVDMQLASIRERIPEDRLEESRDRLAFATADQFVVKTLLLEEADRQGVTASQEEIEAAFARITENLPEGQTLEAIIAMNPRGEAGLREDVTAGLRINKLLANELKERLAVTDAEIEVFRNENAERMERPERVRARHILIKTDPEDDAAARTAQKEALEAIRQQILDGANFAELAGEHSACPSRQRGGDLGYFTRGRMAKPFEEAAFSQEIDAIGPVIETEFGYHIVQVIDKQVAGQAGQEEVREMLKQRKQKKVVRTYIKSLREGADIVVKGKPLPEE